TDSIVLDTMHGSHNYNNPLRPPTSNPPAPEWRLSATATPQRHPPPPPPPPPPQPSQSYSPGTAHGSSYGHPPPNPGVSASPASGVISAAGANTTSWGVNYNRQNYIPTPPPLPPRPASATGHLQNAHSPIVSSPATAPSYGGQISSGDYSQQWTSHPSYAPQPPVTSLSPPPPPATNPHYQAPASAPTQQTWHQQPPPSYSNIQLGQYHPSPTAPAVPSTVSSPPPVHLPPTGFSQQPYPQLVSSPPPERPATHSPAPQILPVVAPPVPPKMSPLVIPAGPSALGSGGPSDWEHLSPVPGDVDDVDIFKPKRDTIPLNSVLHELAPSQPVPPPPLPPSIQNQMVSPDAPPPWRDSPDSLGGSHDFHAPPRPARMNSTESDYSAVSALETPESIDGVIEAWNRPLAPQNKPPTEQRTPDFEPQPVSPHQSPSPLDIPAKHEPPLSVKETAPNAVVDRVKVVISEPAPQIKPVDPYEDMDPWAKSSLERYVAMLRKEAVADSDEERFKLFTAFMAKESKLREILYNIEHEPKSDGDSTPRQSSVTVQPPAKEPDSNTPAVESGLIPVDSEMEYPMSVVSSGGVEDGSYSPGGRPILPRLHTPQPPSLHRSASNPASQKYGPELSTPSHTLRAASVPPSMDEVHRALSPLTTNPPQRIYTPFRYTEGPQRGSDELVFDRPAYQAYSALRQASAESGRVMSDAPPTGDRDRSSSVASKNTDQDETFVGLIREKSVAYRKRSRKASSSSSSPVPPLPAALRRQGKVPGAIEELRSIISSSTSKKSESLWHTTARKDLERYANDFGFILEVFKPWESANKLRRENLERERVKRQEESESHIDDLFNGKEIGYADINILEEEFRQTEARTQLGEERRELDSFIANVFTPLDKRLEDEISALGVHYESALGQLGRENSHAESSADKPSISHTMKIVNEIHHRLEMRYHKRLEIALDRERRRKKAERRPLVFMGDSAALKKLDHDFDQMEKQNILEAARGRDERANRLMDAFDDAILRGLGENQTHLDELVAKVGPVDATAIGASSLPEIEIEQVLTSVSTLVESLRQDSESILHSFGIADSALNNADYSVSVSEARYSNAEPEVFRQLEAEKKKEDGKIQDNLRTKLQSVRVGPAKITATVNAALRSLGKTPPPEPPVPSDDIPASQAYDVSVPGPRPASTVGTGGRKVVVTDDAVHRERLRRALADAKKRNAAKNSS
ncbi:hypothetical protein ARAM_003236, partial [Aspergillus rambellii]